MHIITLAVADIKIAIVEKKRFAALFPFLVRIAEEKQARRVCWVYSAPLVELVYIMPYKVKCTSLAKVFHGTAFSMHYKYL